MEHEKRRTSSCEPRRTECSRCPTKKPVAIIAKEAQKADVPESHGLIPTTPPAMPPARLFKVMGTANCTAMAIFPFACAAIFCSGEAGSPAQSEMPSCHAR